MTNLDSIFKSRDVALSTKVCLLKAMVFPAVMYGCESWIIKKAEPWGSDVFGLRCWRRLLTVPWTAKSSNQSTLKEISPEYSLEGLRLRLKLQYFDHLLKTNRLLGKDLGRLKADREEDDRGWDHWMASLTWWPWVWVRSRCWWWTGKPGMLQSMGSQGVRIDWVTKLNWIN